MRAVLDRGVFWIEGCYGQRGVMDRGLLWTEGCYGQRVVMDRGLLWTEGCYGQAWDFCGLFTKISKYLGHS